MPPGNLATVSNRVWIFAFVVHGQAVDIKLLELINQEPHQPTQEEKLSVRKWDSLRRMISGAKGLDAELAQLQIPTLDFAPSGHLQVVLAEGWPRGSGLRCIFGDGEKQQVEELINPILTAMATSGGR